MRNRKKLASRLNFSLIQFDQLDENGNSIRTSYEVIELNKYVVGRFGSLKEAQNLFNLLCLPDKNQLMRQTFKDMPDANECVDPS